ncbi:hypothetical protein AB4238_01675 [Shewanella sp. 10N.286.45.A1]|uniref:hypothetical protein n=1 Tax=Shewanella sp. 10N.286.45.A1 TaxID=3229694 RepID=UPI0035539B0F
MNKLKLCAIAAFAVTCFNANAGGWSYEETPILSEPYTQYKTTCRYSSSERYVVNNRYVHTKHHNESVTSTWARSPGACASGWNVIWGWDNVDPDGVTRYKEKSTLVPLVAKDIDTRIRRDQIGTECNRVWKANGPYNGANGVHCDSEAPR